MSHPPGIADRIRDGDEPLLRMWPDDLSINEMHAIAIGLGIGLLIGEQGLSLKTILSEPHYFIIAFTVGYYIARNLYPKHD